MVSRWIDSCTCTCRWRVGGCQNAVRAGAREADSEAGAGMRQRQLCLLTPVPVHHCVCSSALFRSLCQPRGLTVDACVTLCKSSANHIQCNAWCRPSSRWWARRRTSLRRTCTRAQPRWLGALLSILRSAVLAFAVVQAACQSCCSAVNAKVSDGVLHAVQVLRRVLQVCR